MRNQYKILAEKYEQQIEGRKPGTPKVTPYTTSDGTTAYKSLTKWGKRQDWRTSAAAHKAAGIPEPKQEVKEEMEPVDDKPDAEDRVADGMTAKLNMTDKSHDSVSHVLRVYLKELEAEWKQHNPTQPMPDDVKEELWHSIYKGMKQAGVDSTEY